MKVTLLGSGTSSGVPRIGGEGPDWGACDPNEPKNRRRRVSLLVQHGGKNVLIDTSPDLRMQLIDAAVGRIDAVLYTHDHADHAHGIDDLRQVFHNMHRPIDCYASPATWAVLGERFSYVFAGTEGYPATCIAHEMPMELQVGAMMITPFTQHHGPIDSLGFRIEADGVAIAYSTDIKLLPEPSVAAVEHLDLWVVDALRYAPHPTHTHLDQTLGWIARVQPRRAVLTHMDNGMDYATLRRALPTGVEPGYDGQVIEL
jgi:phosphoribosyl 1,2-cyclic phosphate phosphodiesterase